MVKEKTSDDTECYGVFCSSGWCEIDNMNSVASKEKAKTSQLYYQSRPDNNNNEYIIAKHTADCSKKYPRCCFPKIRIDESVITLARNDHVPQF